MIHMLLVITGLSQLFSVHSESYGGVQVANYGIVHNEPCGSVQPIYGMALKGHVFQTLRVPSSLHCLKACNNESRCQSINHLMGKDVCELNTRTKEARPENLVPDKAKLYMKRFKNRVALASIPELATETCQEIEASEEGKAVSGKYWLNTISPGTPALVYCEMKTEETRYWPAGSYGIPMAASGCPDTDSCSWLVGSRYEDMEDTNHNSSGSEEFHLKTEIAKNIKRWFCIKSNTTIDKKRSPWPPGKYCIYKKGGSCPTNLTPGYIHWDDEDNDNENKKTGTLPDGIYDGNTKMEFCCRTDGDKKEPIALPSTSPFFLLAHGSAECQQVKWAVVSVEWIRFDTENDGNRDSKGGSHPYVVQIPNPQVHYCYYQGCNQVLTAVNGTFQSPNYPQGYPDGQYCSWTITVSPAQQILLNFTSFILQKEINTDGLYVYDGKNTTGKVLGVFYGDHPPPGEGIYSSSNHMFVIFISDNNSSYTGFNASYNAVSLSDN